MKKTKIRKVAFGLLYVLLFLLLAGIFIKEIGIHFAEQALKEKIEDVLPQNYSISYKNLRLNYWESKLNIKDLIFSPDSIALENQVERLFEFHIPTVDIHLKSLSEIFLEKKLVVKGISIVDPKIIIRDFSSVTGTNITNESVSLFELITRYLTLFEIQHLEIEDAKFRYDIGNEQWGEKLKLEDIDFILKKFSLDSTLVRHQFFNAESIELIINQESFNIPNQAHNLAFDQFRLSTKDSILTFKNIRLQPLDELLKKKDTLSSIYNITIPEITLKGVDYYKSYLQRELNIKKVLLEKPIIDVQEVFSGKSSSPKIKNNALLEVLSKFAPNLNIDHIQFHNGEVSLNIQDMEEIDFRLFLTSLNLYDFSMNLQELYFDRKNFPFKHFEAELKNVRQTLPDGVHKMDIDKLFLDSKKKTLQGFNLMIQPPGLASKPGSFRWRQSFPQLYITGLDYFGIMFGDPVHLGQVILNNPETQLEGIDLTTDSIQKDTLKLWPLLMDIKRQIGKPVSIRNFQINEGALEWDDHISLDRYNLKVKGFYLAQKNQSFEEMIPEFELVIQKGKGTISEHHFQVDSIFTNGKIYRFNDLNWKSNTPRKSVSLQLPYLVVNHPSIDSFFHQDLFFDSIRLSNPKLEIQYFQDTSQSKKDRKSRTFNTPFRCPSVVVNNAIVDVQFSEGEFVKFDGYNSKWKIDSTLELQHFSLKNFQWLTPDDHKKISFEHIIRLTGEESYVIDQLSIQPQHENALLATPLQIPRLHLIGLDKNRLLNKEALAFRKVKLKEPFFDLAILRDRSPKENTFFELGLPLFIDSLTIEKGRLGAKGNTKQDTGMIALSIPVFNWNGNGFSLKAGKNKFSEIENWFDDWDFQALHPISILAPGIDVKVKHSGFQTRSGKLMLKDLVLEQETSEFNQISRIETIELVGFTPFDLVQRHIFNTKSFTLKNIKVNYRPSAQKKPTNTIFPPTSIQLPLEQIQIQQFHLTDADFTLSGPDPFTLKGISVEGEQLSLPAVLFLNKIDQHFERLKFRVKRINYLPGKKDYYHWSFSLHYDSHNKKLVQDDFRIQPTISLDQYSSLKQFRSDYLDLSAENITISSLSLGALFEEPLNLSKIAVQGGSIAIVRDENLPLKDQFKPLLQDQIKSIPYKFGVDTFSYKGSVFFTALPEGADEEAWITIDSVETRIMNISNQPVNWKRDLKLLAKGKFYKEWPFMVRMKFDMQDSLNAFDMRGWMGEADLRPLNNVFTPLSRVKIHKGFSKEMTFDISANTNYAIGELYFKYNKLRIKIVDKDNIHKIGFGNRILSFWANQIVKSNNPTFVTVRKGIIYYERNKNKETVNLWVHSILSGLVSSVGVKNNRKKLKKMGIDDLEALDYQKLFGDIIKK